MILCYVDEAGDPHPHQEPLFDGHTPLFCLTAVAVEAERWRDLDRALLGLKRTYFKPEMEAFATRNPGKRPEHFEVKGTYLCKPSNARMHRNRVFTLKILEILGKHRARLFAAIWRKDAANPSPPATIYNHSLQIVSERFHHHCSALGRKGLMIADSRTKALDFNVAAGHLSFLFGHHEGRTYTSIVEAPLFADSSLSAGVQYADIVGACVYGNYYQRRCAGIAGHSENGIPISAQRYAKLDEAARSLRTPRATTPRAAGIGRPSRTSSSSAPTCPALAAQPSRAITVSGNSAVNPSRSASFTLRHLQASASTISSG
jgi:Protein of unknown function (DUF3800)